MAKFKRRSAGRRPAPMRVSEGFKALVLDNLSGLGDVIARSMFGGVGLYCGGLFFGIIAADVMYLKVDAGNRTDFERAGMRPFTPYPDRGGTMQYYAVPLEVIECAPDLVEWSRRAVAVDAIDERMEAVLRYSEIVAIGLVIALVVWLNMPKLLWPAVIVTTVLCSVDRWWRGVYPWPPRKRSN